VQALLFHVGNLGVLENYLYILVDKDGLGIEVHHFVGVLFLVDYFDSN
jgi:hypothetical protein